MIKWDRTAEVECSARRINWNRKPFLEYKLAVRLL